MFFQFEKLFHESLDSLIKNIVKIRIISEHSHVECNVTILHEIILRCKVYFLRLFL